MDFILLYVYVASGLFDLNLSVNLLKIGNKNLI